MKIQVILITSLFAAFSSFCQQEIPEAMKRTVPVDRKDFSANRYYYGIKPTSQVSELDDIFVRNFETVCKISYVKAPERIKTPAFTIGFYGFSRGLVYRLDTLWGKPSDTNSRPCEYNLLCDVAQRATMALEIVNLAACSLVMIDIQQNKKVRELLSAKNISLPPGQPYFYLLWNTSAFSSLPSVFSSSSNVVIGMVDPVPCTSWEKPGTMAESAPVVVEPRSPTPHRENFNPTMGKAVAFSIIDSSSGKPIHGFYVTCRKNRDYLFENRKSGPGDSMDIPIEEASFYLFYIFHPDYQQATIPIKGSDLINGVHAQLVPKKQFNVFYIYPTYSFRYQTIKSLKEEVATITSLRQPYLLFISTQGKPFIAQDQTSFEAAIKKLIDMMDNNASFKTDYQLFSDFLKKIELTDDERLVLYFYLTKDAFHSGGKEFVENINKNILEMVLTDKKSLNIIFSDDEIHSDSKYSNCIYLNLLNEVQ